jgi:DNA mismatch repair protein MSH6
MLSANNIHIYDVNNCDTLILDGQTLINLEIFENSDGGKQGTLWELLDKGVTPFGKRMMRKWVARPTRNVAELESRLDAIEELSNDNLAG